MKHNAWHTGDNKWSLFIAANVPPPMKQSTRLARPGPVHFCVTVASNTHLARSSPIAGPDMSCSSPSLRSHLSCFLLTEMPVSTGYNLSHPSSPAETFHLHNTPLNRPLLPSCYINSSPPKPTCLATLNALALLNAQVVFWTLFLPLLTTVHSNSSVTAGNIYWLLIDWPYMY